MIKGNKKSHLFEKIKKLLESKTKEDFLIGDALLMENMFSLTPNQFETLADIHWDELAPDWWDEGYELSMQRIHKYYYDKRKEEARANKGRDTEKSEPL